MVMNALQNVLPTGLPTGNRRSALRRMGACVLLLGTRQLAFGASIVAVRVWPAADYTRVTIESDLERGAWLKLSEESLNKVWDNDADDIFNELLEK